VNVEWLKFIADQIVLTAVQIALLHMTLCWKICICFSFICLIYFIPF